jgi:hypothetical protein
LAPGNSVTVTKIGAATRLLESAIRLHLANEDALAVHVVASSAYRLLRDVAEQRGHDHLEDLFGLTLYYLGRDYLAGAIPSWARETPFLADAAKTVGEAIRSGQVSGPADVELSLSAEWKRQRWREINAAFNFLKHADFDASKSLDLSSVDVENTLGPACRLFHVVLPDQASSAVMAFEALIVWRDGNPPGPDWMRSIFEWLGEGLDDASVREQLLQFCERSA